MKKRLSFLLLALLAAFCIYAIARMAMNFPGNKLGYDAMDYVSLHGNIQFENATVGSVRPTDVTGVYIVEGSANNTMIGLLRHLPNLRRITIGPDYRLIPIGTAADKMPRLTEAATSDQKRMQTAFPDLEVRVVEPIYPAGG